MHSCSSPIPKCLRDAFAQKKLIPIVAAGVSMSLLNKDGSGLFPSWAGLLEKAAEKLNAENKNDEAYAINAMLRLRKYQEAADLAKEYLTGSLWNQLFKEALDVNYRDIDTNSLALPQAIWTLSERIITLNYDKVLRFSCPNHHDLRELDNTTNGLLAEFLRDEIGKPAVWHLHGKIDNLDQIIFTSDRYNKLYIDRNREYSGALAALHTISSTSNLLFVGCSMDDAELLQQIHQVHTLFVENTGPHYALVLEADSAAIKTKLKGLPIEVISFVDFGKPLIDTIYAISNTPELLLESGSAIPTATPMSTAQPKSVSMANGETRRIAALTACPIGEKLLHNDLLREFKSFKCEISYFSLSRQNLNELENFDYIFILSTLVKKKIIIEGKSLEAELLTFRELEAEIGNTNCKGVFIFLNHVEAASLDADDIGALRNPTLILPALSKSQISSIAFKLFKQGKLDYIEESRVINQASFSLSPFLGTPKESKLRTTLPLLIDAKNTNNYVGRRTDLSNLCRDVIALQSKNGVLSIKGSGGIGKTITIKKIAVALAERHFFQDGIDFIDCEFIRDYAMFEKKLAANFDLENALDIKEQIKTSLDKQNKLIILDNAETLLHLPEHQQIKDFIYFVCDYASVVITTRESLGLDCEVIYELRPFTTDEACELFFQVLGNRQLSVGEKGFIRQEIVEQLLDNNPLAITLVANNIPKSKSFHTLRDDLKNDFFRKISDADMAAFDRVSDINIERKKSLYSSINFSYQHLDGAQKMAFEMLSLFPDGIHVKILQQIAQSRKISQRNQDDNVPKENKPTLPPKPLITDGVIKALEDKSVIQVDHGVIKLQSIVGKFAERQWNERNEHERRNVCRNAVNYLRSLSSTILGLPQRDRSKGRKIFGEHQRNFFKSFDYVDAVGLTELQILDYVDDLHLLVMNSSAADYTAVLTKKWPKVFSENTSVQKFFEVLLQCNKYYEGDFENAFHQLKKLIPAETTLAAQSRNWWERLTIYYAVDIYGMEGEGLLYLKYCIQTNRIAQQQYPAILFELGVIDYDLLKCFDKNTFFTLEALHAIGSLKLETVEECIASAYSGSHLELMQVYYVKSKLCQREGKFLDTRCIKKLVSINPYTLGLQQLMLAMAAVDGTEKIERFRQALPNLLHIKYYYVEALLLYASHLQASGLHQEFEAVHAEGLALASRHHYRWLRYQFESLLGQIQDTYNPDMYPLPEQLDIESYVQLSIKEFRG